jgi:RNA polymerase sigma-70 factor, ECF subfamily
MTWTQPRKNRVVDDTTVADALRAGDESAFREVVAAYHPALLRLASFYVSSRAVAEEVVQDTWLAVIKGLDGFEGRSSFKTWVFAILANRARTRGARESRSVPFSSLEADEQTLGVPGDRFRPGTDRWPGHWSEPPTPWNDVPAAVLEGKETRTLIFDAIRSLPPPQREVIALRDVEGWSAEEVCAALALSDGNQRVLLHRARGNLRAVLEDRVERAVTT